MLEAQKESAAYDFEATVRLVKSISGDQDKENSAAELRREMDPIDRVFASILDQNNKAISALTRQFAGFNVSAPSRERQFGDQRNLETPRHPTVTVQNVGS